MVFKRANKGVGYYRDDQSCVVSLAKQLMPMKGCAPLKLRIEELLSATPNEANDVTPKTSPGTVTERLGRKSADPKWTDGLILG